MMMRLCLSFLLLILSIETFSQDIDFYADSLRQANNIPALAYSVVTSDSIIHANVIGVRKYNTDDSVSQSDRFHLGSNTKALTAVIAAKLVEQSFLKWDTKIFDLFPEWKDSSHADFNDVTLSGLLSHRAQILPFTSGTEFEDIPGFKGTDSQRRGQFAQWLLKQEPVVLEHVKFKYSNAGYSIAAVMLEKVSGKSWEELILDILGEQLQINPKFSWPNFDEENQPWGHWIENGKMVALPPDHFYRINPLIAPAGDINMSLADYAKFIQENLKGLSGNSDILSTKSWEYLFYGKVEYSMGWAWKLENSKPIAHHDGSAGTFFCHAKLSGHDDFAIIIIANAAHERTVNAIYELSNQLFKTFKPKN